MADDGTSHVSVKFREVWQRRHAHACQLLNTHSAVKSGWISRRAGGAVGAVGRESIRAGVTSWSR